MAKPEPPPEPPTVVIDGVSTGGGDGGDDGGQTYTVSGGGGGSSGGSSGGGGGGEPLDPLMAYRAALLRMRVPPGPYIQLMHQAAQQNWTTDEFIWALESDPRFQKTFPGINALLDQGMSIPTAVGQWRGMYTEWHDAFKDAGLSKFARLTPKRFGMYLENGVDLEEAVFRVSIVKMAKTSEPFRLAFNQILKKRGQGQLNKQGWAQFLAGRGDQQVYDLYEGALLLQELGGEGGLRVQEARRLGKMVSGPEGGPAFSAAGFAEAVENIRRALGSELIESSGLGAKGIALAALKDQVTKPGAKRKAVAASAQLEQMLANQQAASQARGGEVSSVVAGRPIASSAPGG